MMPEMNGLDLVRAVVEEFPMLPIVLMTSQGSEEVAVEALESGASSYVPKRILASEMRRVVDRVVSASQAKVSHSALMGRVNRNESIELENDLEMIQPLVGYLRETYCHFGLCDQSESMRIATALDEALSNAFYHGNLEVDSALREAEGIMFYELALQRCQKTPYRDRLIHVNAQFSPSQGSVSIRDEGSGFDVSALPDPTDPENLCRPHGRGVLLMRMFMDEVRYNSTGNQVTLTKRRAPK
jgi:anti-sigma regulatory factor (Ser/Thr protein kinase)